MLRIPGFWSARRWRPLLARSTGCNVENAAYGLSICAEQVAITGAVAAGFREFSRLVVVANPLASPCGACRQVIAEFLAGDAMVYSFDCSDPSHGLSWSVSELLPDRFRLDGYRDHAQRSG